MGDFFNKNKEKNNNESPKKTSDRKFYSKITDLFSTEPQKEKVLRHEDFNGAGDVYYASVSAAYKIASRILLLLLVIFLVFSVIINYKQITYDNFFYLLKDFSASVDAESTNYDTLSYDSDSRHSFSLYRGGLAIVNPSRLTAFTATGRRTLDVTSEFSSPNVVCSDKYILVYDSSDGYFAIYNSFARVYSETSETLKYPVTDACFGDDGSFAIVTRSAKNKSVVRYYSKNMKEVFADNSNELCLDVQINSKQKILTSVHYDVGDNGGKTVISVINNIDDKNKREKIEYEISGEFPIASQFLDNGNKFAVITDRSIKIFNFDKELRQIVSEEFSASYISGFYAEKNGIAISYVSESKNHIIVFDKSGEMVYNDLVSVNVRDIGYDEYVFLQTDSGVLRMDISKNEATSMLLQAQSGKMIVYDHKTAVICGESKAEYVVFE